MRRTKITRQRSRSKRRPYKRSRAKRSRIKRSRMKRSRMKRSQVKRPRSKRRSYKRRYKMKDGMDSTDLVMDSTDPIEFTHPPPPSPHPPPSSIPIPEAVLIQYIKARNAMVAQIIEGFKKTIIIPKIEPETPAATAYSLIIGPISSDGTNKPFKNGKEKRELVDWVFRDMFHRDSMFGGPGKGEPYFTNLAHRIGSKADIDEQYWPLLVKKEPMMEINEEWVERIFGKALPELSRNITPKEIYNSRIVVAKYLAKHSPVEAGAPQEPPFRKWI